MTTAGWIFMLVWWIGLVVVAVWSFFRLMAPPPPTHNAPDQPTPRD